MSKIMTFYHYDYSVENKLYIYKKNFLDIDVNLIKLNYISCHFHKDRGNMTQVEISLLPRQGQHFRQDALCSV